MAKSKTSFKQGNEYWRRVAKENRGRPSKFDPEMCDMVEAMGEQGMCLTEIAYELGISRQTLHVWAKEKPDFSDSLACAVTAAETYWTRYGTQRLQTKEFQGNTWVKMMQARFKDNWTNRTELTGANGGAIETKHTEEKRDELKGLIAKRRARDATERDQSGDGSGSDGPGDGSPPALADHSKG